MVSSADALLEFNDGRDKLMVNGTYGISYDSNLFAHAGGGGDYNQSLALGVSYLRRAGLIGVNGSLTVTSGRFNKYTAQDFTNPNLQLEFTKDRGRLTGGFSLSANRDSSSDLTINQRTDSWNYASSFKFRYPINDRYYFTSLLEYARHEYLHNAALFTLSSYAESLDVYYTYTSKLDLFAGARFRAGDAQGGSRTQDNAVTFGAIGSILPKLSGSLNLGYQWRTESGAQGRRYDTMTSSISLSWPVTKRISFSGSVAKDFVTAASDVSIDSSSASLSATLKPVGRITTSPGVTYSVNRFLGAKGAGREDRMLSANLEISLAFTTHISASISYAYMINHSNVAFSEFGRHTASLNLSARY